jgi:glyoxylase-like metal-dependent hydrolase (beta-lactamase superfamily II)
MQEAGHLKFTDGEEGFSGFDFIEVDGHTEKMMLPLIKYKEKKILYCADLLPSTVHIPVPWVMAYDIRPLTTMEEKQRILIRAAKENWILFFEHDRNNECCTLSETEKGVKVKDTFKLDEL